MADQRAQYTEEAVGANHPTKADVINRLALVEHGTDGVHKMGATPSAIGTALQQLRVNAGEDALEFFTPSAGLPLGHLSGLAMTHDTDTDHDITIAAGKCRDSTDADDLSLAATLTKRADAAWAVGSTNGGMDTGSIPASGTLHVWLIKRSDTGVVDALFSISATAPTMPASYDYKRLIGSYRTNSSNNIINGDWWGTGLNRTFMFDTPILDVSNATSGTDAVTAALSTPAGIITKALVNCNGASNLYLSSLNNADGVPSGYDPPLASVTAGASQAFIFTNTASQIRYRHSTNSAVYIATIGYEMSL
jgi:hypothetical protein